MKYGYCGIGIFHGKNEENLGTLWRTAYNLSADFIFTIGRRYKKQCSDTAKSTKQIPLYHYNDWEDFLEHIPYGCQVTAVELNERANNLKTYIHPRQCIYLLGAEDYGIPERILDKCQDIVMVDSNLCMNVAITGGIVLYDRMNKL